MLHFGRDFGGRAAQDGRGALGERLSADPALMQLLPLMALRAEAGATGLAAHAAGKGEAAGAFLSHALVLREIARRTGEVETLARAASAVLRARDLSKGDRRIAAQALFSHAQILFLASTLFGDDEAAKVAGQRLDEASALPLDLVARARVEALRAALLGRGALGDPAAIDPARYTAAVAAASAAVHGLEAQARIGKLDDSEVHEARCDRIELLIASGQQAKNRRILEQACDELHALIPLLDAAYRPLTWARSETLRGQTLAALGDLIGEAAPLAEGSAVLNAVVEEIPDGHSPLDSARAGHALGLVLQALGEACEEEALFDKAIAAFAPALQTLDASPLLPLRAVVAHDGAVCLARRAERRGDLKALVHAEAAFRDTLKRRSAVTDPVAWAVTQVALARIYEAEAEIRGDIRGDGGRLNEAAFALASALEVFGERGLRSLSEVALAALTRVTGAA